MKYSICSLVVTAVFCMGGVSEISAATVYDVNGDGREGLAETIHSLRVSAGLTPVTNPDVYTNSINMRLNFIPAGSFVMGSPAGTGDVSHYPIWPSEYDRGIDEKQHVVILSKPYYMQTTEVTQDHWKEVMGGGTTYHYSYSASCGGDCPVNSVSWTDSNNFVTALNIKENRTNCSATVNTCYSLPLESQWEYAARAGTVTTMYNGEITIGVCSLDPTLDKIGWYCGNSGTGYLAHPVGQKDANNFGLYDMAGNVTEWCLDWYGSYEDGPVTDPTGAETGATEHVNRGGAANGFAHSLRLANRDQATPGTAFFNSGFRLVLSSGQ